MYKMSFKKRYYNLNSYSTNIEALNCNFKKQFSSRYTTTRTKWEIASRRLKVKGKGIFWHLLASFKGKIYWQGYSWTNPNV